MRSVLLQGLDLYVTASDSFTQIQFTFGNFNEWIAHLGALTKMIDMRGGLDTLGVGGFLQEIIVK